MKKQILVLAMAALVAVGGWFGIGTRDVSAMDGPDLLEDAGGPGEWCAPGQGRGIEQRLELMTLVLDLTAEQTENIRAILTAGRAEPRKMRTERRDYREQMHDLLTASVVDEKAIRALVAEQAQEKADLMVARAKAHAKVMAVLTPEQREKARKVFSLMGPKAPRGGGKGFKG